MNLQTLPVIITMLIALSVATERFVEIIKGLIWTLSEERTNPRDEARRKAWLQGLAVLGGIGITALASPVISEIFPTDSPVSTTLALGLLSSGGSGFWNSILGYVSNVKDLQRANADATAKLSGQLPAAARQLPKPGEGVLPI